MQDDLTIDVARVIATYALTDELSVGLRGGYEQTNLVSCEDGCGIYGAEWRWRPSERTYLTGFVEDRFFGTGWNLAFTHRMPRLAWNLVLSRGIDTSPQQLFTLPASNNVQSLVDAMFTTRFPDPVERARVVQDFINQQSLATSTRGPTTIYAQRFSLVDSRIGSVAWLGTRNTVALSGFYVRTRDRSKPACSAPATPSPTTCSTARPLP